MAGPGRRVSWRQALFFLAAAVVITADQLSKAWIRANIPYGGVLFDSGFLRIDHVRNTGAAFGLFSGQSEVLTVISLIASLLLLAYAIVIYRYMPLFDNLPGWLTLGLLLGGTVGNLVDRVRLGYVTDFIDFKVWPAFNVADSAVTLGEIILLYLLLRMSVRTEKDGPGP